MFKDYNLSKINKCRCGGTPNFRPDIYYIHCKRCRSQGQDGESSFLYTYTTKERREERLNEIINSWNLGKYTDWQDDFEFTCAKEPLEFKKTKLKSPNYYLKLIQKEGNIEKFYYSQASNTTYIYDRKIFDCWLPMGIKQMDNWYSLRIKELNEENARFQYTAKELENMILRNPYLHEVIKSNLIENLKYYGKN